MADEDLVIPKPEEELTPEFREFAGRLVAIFLEEYPEYIELDTMVEAGQGVVAFDIPYSNPRQIDSSQQTFIGGSLRAAMSDAGIELVELDFSDPEALSIVLQKAEIAEVQESLGAESQPYISEPYESAEVVTEKNREQAEFRSKTQIKFHGKCGHCQAEVEIEETYKGKKPKVKKGKKTFDLDYGNVSCPTEGCIDTSSYGKYSGKQREVLLYYRHTAGSEAEVKQWILDNIEENK